MENQKAWVIDDYSEGVEGMKLKEIPIPKPGEGEVQIKLKATSLNPVDWKLRKGYLKGFYPVEFPAVLGWDVSGEISDLGYGVSQFSVGDEVYAYGRRLSVGLHLGTYCEYVCLPSSFVCLKPKNLSFEEAASVPLTGLTAYQTVVEKGKLKSGQTIVVMGASGGVGSWAIQYASIIGAKTIIGVASSKNHEFLKSLGATHCIDYKMNVSEEVNKIASHGIDLLVDYFGSGSMDKMIPNIKKGGKEKTIFVSICELGWKPSTDQVIFDTVFVIPKATQLAVLKQWFEEKKLKTNVTTVHDFKDIHEATKKVESLHTQGKIVVKINP